jgi:membrane-anchored protein YejM (alkaline phosphatase superfamily)
MLRTLLVTAKVEYMHYREEEIVQRNSGWDYFVKYGHRHRLFDKNKKEETIVQRTTRIAKQIAQKIRRSVRVNTFLLVKRTLVVFRAVLMVLFLITHMILFVVIPLFLGTAIRGMLGVVLLITIRLVLQFQFFLKPTVWLVYKILHF